MYPGSTQVVLIDMEWASDRDLWAYAKQHGFATVTQDADFQELSYVNRSLRGWANYFDYRNSSRALNKIRNHVEDRLRTHLMKRHKVKGRGTGLRRFPSRNLYGRYGLYKAPVAAGWRSVHALV